MFREASIDCPADLKERWPVPLADEWHKGYPELFDDDDLRLAHNQPAYHFFEWLSAIYLFHRDGVHALVEKYAYGNHLRKTRLLEELVAQDERDFIRGFRDAFGVQPPDLLVFRPDRSAYWFAEAKGPSDRLSRRQRRGHEQIVATLGVPVELIDVHMA